MRRLQTNRILKDLEKKIVFLAGPRQVGKTWVAQEVAALFKNSLYLNYDHAADKDVILSEGWLEKTDLLILDELHKMKGWKNYLKGVFDTKPAHMRMIVTGSARLETFRQSGDSLAGRFFNHRLLPLSMKELCETEFDGDLDRLLKRGGFPEPFLAENDDEAQRWRKQYSDGLIREDIFNFENIQDLRSIQLVLSIIQRRVGSPISFTSIARDVGIAPATVIKYIQILESLYIIFRVTPFSHNIARSLLKEPKIYFFDTGMVEGDDGIRLENIVAVSLLKHIYGMNDYQGADYALHYLRTKDGREVDFCIAQKDMIESALEVKKSDQRASSGLVYFCEKYHLTGIQIVQNLKMERREGSIELRKADRFLSELYL